MTVTVLKSYKPLTLLLLVLLFISVAAKHLPRSLEVYEDFFVRPKYDVNLETDVIPESLVEQYIKDNSSSLSYVKTISHYNENLLCFYPKEQTSQSSPSFNSSGEELDAKTKIEKALEVLEPMKSTCILANTGWWTYEICHLSHVRQFHQEGSLPHSGGGGEITTEFFLGRFDFDFLNKSKIIEGTKSLKGDTLSIRLFSGTKCDLTGLPREIELQYMCSTAASPLPDRLASIREVSMCNYVAIIHTARLCSIPGFFRHDVSEVGKIDCYKVLSEADYEVYLQNKIEDASFEKEELQQEKSTDNQKTGSKAKSKKGSKKSNWKDLEALIQQVILKQANPDFGVEFTAEDGEAIQFKVAFPSDKDDDDEEEENTENGQKLKLLRKIIQREEL